MMANDALHSLSMPIEWGNMEQQDLLVRLSLDCDKGKMICGLMQSTFVPTGQRDYNSTLSFAGDTQHGLTQKGTPPTNLRVVGIEYNILF